MAALAATLPSPCLGETTSAAASAVLPREPQIHSIHSDRKTPGGDVAQGDSSWSLSGYLLFRDFCLNHLEEAKPLVEFYEEVRWGLARGRWSARPCSISVCHLASVPCALQIKKYEKLETEEERVARSREIFDAYIMKELLACSHVSGQAARLSPASPVP